MAKNEVNMKRIILIVICMGFSLVAFSQNYKWQRTAIDGSRTGVVSPSADNVKESLGEVKGKKYYGNIFTRPYMLQLEGQYKNYPLRTFVSNNFQDGYSDHFPVYIYISK